MNESKEFINVPYLRRKYMEFNHKYFDDALQDYPIRVANLNVDLAKVVIRGLKGQPETYHISELVFSTRYFQTETQVLTTLLHEMVHISLIENNVETNYSPPRDSGEQKDHGPIFRKTLSAILQQAGLPPEEPSRTETLKVDSAVVKPRMYGFIIRQFPKLQIAVFSYRFTMYLSQWIQAFNLENIKPIVGLSNNVLLQKFKVRRTLGHTFTTEPLTQQEFDELMDDCEVLWEYKGE